MKASLWQSGLPAGLSRQAAPGRQATKGFGGRTISSLPSFPLVFLCVGGGSKREWGRGKVFKEDPGEEKRLKHQVLGSQIASPEKSLFVPC